MKRRPNVVFITTDQQRYDSLSLHGSDFIHTPNMDLIGKEGVSFRRAYCPNTVCTPSRVSMMTGQHLSRHGAYNIGTYASDYSVFLSQILRNEGYRTHHIGKAHWHPWEAPSPETREVDADGTPFRDLAGFETAELSLGHGNWAIDGHYAQWIKRKGYDINRFKVKERFEGDYYGTGDWELPCELHSGAWLVERALEFLRKHNPDQPFYLNLGFPDPHHPHVLPHDYEGRIDPYSIPLPEYDTNESFGTEHVPHFLQGTLIDSRFNGRFVMAGNGAYAWADYFQDERKARETRAYYYSMVQLIDEQLGHLLDALNELNLRENTILVFTSDHGEMLGDHHIGQKGPLVYEGVARVPLLIRYPDGFAPCDVDECVSLVDIAPTILDFAHIHDGIRRDGISLKQRLQQQTALERAGVRMEYKEEPDRIRFKCWVTLEWKLAIYAGESFGELFDLQRDPGENTNLFDHPDYQGVKQRLLLELLEDMERSETISIRPCRV